MRSIKSDKLKKLEGELEDLKQWLKLGLVPKKDIEKHKLEIKSLEEKIGEESERLKFLKESGDVEALQPATQKRTGTRTSYTEMPSLPDSDMGEPATNITDGGFMMANETTEGNSIIEESDTDQESDSSSEEEDTEKDTEEEDDGYFSDRRRWSRGGILDPDADDW